jgi:signal transduction histidine kinase
MPSPRTEPERSAPPWHLDMAHGLTAFLQRLNTRMVLAIASVALVSLTVSSIAINQIIPGYLSDQTRQRLVTAAEATGILVRAFANSAAAQGLDGVVQTEELRNRQIVVPAVEFAVPNIVSATVSVYDAENELVWSQEPSDVARLAQLGLARESIEVTPTRVDVPLPDGTVARYRIVITEPYTATAATLAQLRSALIGAGVLALIASLILGALASRRVTAPISRLRRVASSFAQGDLDARAQTSGVLEVDELAQQFNVMADQLGRTLRMLEADRDRLREFVADVSHELRTPIAALRMYNELQRTGKVDDETRTEFMERSADQIHRLEWLSTNLLDLSRIDAGIFPLDMRAGDVRDPVRAVVEAHAEEAEQRGISLTSEVPSSPVEARFDRERIVQLLTNLVANALKFTSRGGGVRVRLDDEAERIRLEVSDTGPGIRPEELPRIFERFYRGTNTGEARASGSGLGLAIVRSIVEMHGGRIDVSSVLGEGTAFRIELPRTPAAVAGLSGPIGARRTNEGS